MDPKSTDPKLLSRKEFFVLTITLVGGAVVESNCAPKRRHHRDGRRQRNGWPGNRGDIGHRRHDGHRRYVR